MYENEKHNLKEAIIVHAVSDISGKATILTQRHRKTKYYVVLSVDVKNEIPIVTVLLRREVMFSVCLSVHRGDRGRWEGRGYPSLCFQVRSGVWTWGGEGDTTVSGPKSPSHPPAKTGVPSTPNLAPIPFPTVNPLPPRRQDWSTSTPHPQRGQVTISMKEPARDLYPCLLFVSWIRFPDLYLPGSQYYEDHEHHETGSGYLERSAIIKRIFVFSWSSFSILLDHIDCAYFKNSFVSSELKPTESSAAVGGFKDGPKAASSSNLIVSLNIEVSASI